MSLVLGLLLFLSAAFVMAASGVMSVTRAQAGGMLVSTSFRKESTSSSCGDALDASSQPCFLGSPRSITRLRRAAVPRQNSSRPVPATSASLSSMIPGNNFMADVEEDDVEKDVDEDEDENVFSSSSELLDTINNVMADVVDGQKYLKETGRTKPRPMKRRSLVICLAMGAIQPYLSEVENRMTNLRRTTSSSLAKTVRLVSQVSFGASRQLSFSSRQLSFGGSRQCSFGAAEAEQLIPAAA